MPLVFHHNDDDGRASAAIVINELLPVFIQNIITTVEYNYGYTIAWDDIIKPTPFAKDTAYFVDICMNDEIFEAIKKCIKMGFTVIHIDHHEGTLKYIAGMTTEQKEVMTKINSFYDMKYSATMLTWVYSCMNEEERKKAGEVVFDFTPNFSHVMINVGKSGEEREYRINPGIFYVDDYDIWRHSTPDTMAFHYGFSTVENKHPKNNEIWNKVLYGTQRDIQKYIDAGRAIVGWKRSDNRFTIRRGYEKIVDGYKLFVINNVADGMLFEDVINNYDGCIAYWYDGKLGKWRHAVRSGENSTFNCNDFAKKHGGGGHPHASGYICDEINI